MASRPPSPTATALIGRQSELDAAARFLGRVRGEGGHDPRPGSLVLQGPAGIGKTALWLAAVEMAVAEGMRVLRARPAEVEAAYSYAALTDLLRDVTPTTLARLPGQQRRTLELALGLGEQGAGTAEPQLVQAAAANLLLLLATESPLVVAIDDAPWLDSPTAAVLEFAARRVTGRPVGFLVTQRAEEETAAPLGLETAIPSGQPDRLWLGPLSVAALHLLLEERLGLTLPRPHLVKLHALSGGVPFHALQIAQALQRGPLPPTGAPLPIPASVRELLSARVADLPTAARLILLLAAAGGTVGQTTVRALLGQPAADEGMAALDETLLSVEGDRLRAAHPLIASTIYETASRADRARAHAELARVIEEPEARARHRALAGDGPDEDVAADLEAAAARARGRGAPDTAAELLHLARGRTPTDEREAYARRSLSLAQALGGADDLSAARDVLDELIPRLGAGRTLAQAQMLRAEIDWYLATSPEAVAHLEAGLAASAGHPDVQADLHYRLAIFLDYELRRGMEHGRVAVRLLEELDNPSALAAALMQLFYAEVLVGERPRPELLERGLAVEPEDSHIATTIPGIWWLALDRTDEARERFETQLERDRRRGQLSSEADLLTRLAEVELYADNYAGALEYADAATMAARQHGDSTADPARRIRALVDAHAGRLGQAREVAQAAGNRAAAAGDHIIAMAWLVVLAFVAASEEDWLEVERLGTESARHMAAIGAVEPLRLGIAHEHFEALAALGRLAEAEELAIQLEQRQERVPRPWLEAALARGRARMLLARGDFEPAAELLGSALATGTSWRRLDRGRALLIRGALLRRLRLRREAAAALDEAQAIFDELGARAWATRAGTESDRLGRRRPGDEGLTPSEAQVAQLAAAGLTNRQVAERLSVSTKTVEAHMGRIYAKLGIRSRAELGRMMAGEAAADGTQQ